MHIPDGFLSVPVSLIMWVASLLAIGAAIRLSGRELGERQVPLMGVLAAAIFAGQMLNFSVAGGTSGHLMGAAIATILLGPWAAVLVLTTVVGVQALIFQDGGLLAMGSNIFNMGVIGVAVSYFVYQSVRKIAGGRSWGIFAGGYLAAWFSIVIASLAVALQLAASGTSPANIAVPTMAGVHALIGIGEGLITLGALSFLYASRRDLLVSGQTNTGSNLSVWIGGLLVAIALAVLAPLASVHPDGLEWVAGQKGFLDLAQNPVYRVIDHFFPGISTMPRHHNSGIIGALLVFKAVGSLSRRPTWKIANRK
jgi:cobalt/nickel transport system permease protein